MWTCQRHKNATVLSSWPQFASTAEYCVLCRALGDCVGRERRLAPAFLNGMGVDTRARGQRAERRRAGGERKSAEERDRARSPFHRQANPPHTLNTLPCIQMSRLISLRVSQRLAWPAAAGDPMSRGQQSRWSRKTARLAADSRPASIRTSMASFSRRARRLKASTPGCASLLRSLSRPRQRRALRCRVRHIVTIAHKRRGGLLCGCRRHIRPRRRVPLPGLARCVLCRRLQSQPPHPCVRVPVRAPALRTAREDLAP